VEEESIAVTKELFSVVILCYRHFEYLFSAIDSVLSQNYPNIELIVSDDNSPNFPKKEVERYLAAHKRENITRTLIRREPENAGTVRHLNHAVQACDGDYIIALAGDDMLQDETVLSRYVNGFSHAPNGCLIEMAQTGMYDEKLGTLEEYFLKPEGKAALKKTKTDSKVLLRLLIRDGACLPSTSTCFRREFFTKFGPFNEEYILVEDYPMHVRLAEEGWIIHYEDFVAIKHRHGGISHGQKRTVQSSSILYLRDSKRLLEEIVFPKIDILSDDIRWKVLSRRKRELLWLKRQIALLEEPQKEKIGSAVFSVIILCYKRFEYLYSAIDSVLSQDYPEIELIISDDCSPEFPREKARRYIKEHKGKNIVRTVIRREPKNGGTVRHLNHAVQTCSGDYIIALAGDDMLQDTRVLSRYVAGFSHVPKGCLIEMAQTAMYDEEMKNVEYFYASPAVQAALRETKESTEALLHLLIRDGPCLPSTSTCFQRDFFKKYGYFDETYSLVEDYPTHVRLVQEGCTIHYENFVAVKHRHGGISHGQKNTASKTAALYFQDIKKMTEEIVLPNVGLLSKEERRNVTREKKRDLAWLNMRIAMENKDYLRLVSIALRHPIRAFWRFMDQLWPTACVWHVKLLAYCLVMWIGIPTAADMGGLIFGIAAQTFERPLYVIVWILFGLWAAIFFAWAAEKLRRKIQRLPKEVFTVG